MTTADIVTSLAGAAASFAGAAFGAAVTVWATHRQHGDAMARDDRNADRADADAFRAVFAGDVDWLQRNLASGQDVRSIVADDKAEKRAAMQARALQLGKSDAAALRRALDDYERIRDYVSDPQLAMRRLEALFAAAHVPMHAPRK